MSLLISLLPWALLPQKVKVLLLGNSLTIVVGTIGYMFTLIVAIIIDLKALNQNIGFT